MVKKLILISALNHHYFLWTSNLNIFLKDCIYSLIFFPSY